MDRDFAYKQSAGKGVVPVKKKIVVWSRQLIIVIGAFITVFIIFFSLSNSRQENPPVKIIGNNESTDKENQTLEFYQVLPQPLIDNVPDKTTPSTVIYQVKSELIRNKVNARSLKALLIFNSFIHVRIETVDKDNHTWHQLIIERISSKSKMNQVRDFLGRYDVDSSYIKIK